MLQEKGVGHIAESAGSKRRHQDACAEESRLQAVAVVGEVLAKAGNHLLARLAIDEPVAQRKEGRRLHRVEDGGLEGAVGLEELALHVGLRIGRHLFERCSIAARGSRHVAHHLGIDDPIGGTQIVPVDDGIG